MLTGSISVVMSYEKYSAKIPVNSKKIAEFYIAGYVFYHGQDIERYIKANDLLNLKREQENIHDNNAIAIYRNEVKLGYVPRHHNEILANIMDNEIKLYARVKYKYIENPTWERIKVEILI